MSDEELIFQEALKAIEAGEKSRARDLLSRLIKVDKNNSQFWLKMSGVVETRKERVFCLKEVLRLDPQNPTARRGLIFLEEAPPDESLTIPFSAQVRNWQASLFANPVTEKTLKRNQLRTILAAVSAFLLLGAIIAVVIFSINQTRPAAPPPIDSAPTIFVYPTAEGSPTPLPRTGTPTPGALSPLSAQLAATYTPTPLAVNTPHPRTEAYRSAISYIQRGDWTNAINLLNQVVTVEPTAADVFYLIGEVNRNQGKYKEAITAYDQAIKINPNFAPAYLGRARARQAQALEPSDPIRADLEKAISLDANLGEAYLELASLKLRKKDTKDLARDLDAAARLMPGSPLVFLVRAQVNLWQSKPEAALEDAQKAYALDITNLQIYRTLAETYRAAKRLSESIQPLEVYTAYTVNEWEPFYWLAQAYFERKTTADLQTAVKALDKCISLNKNLLDAYLLRGNAYLELEKSKEAATDFDTVLLIKPDTYSALLGMGRALLKVDKASDAYNFFSLAVSKSTTNAERAAAYYWRALGLEQIKNITSALADWDALLKLPANDVPAQYRETAQQRIQQAATPTRTPTPTTTPTLAPLSLTITPP
jgi:tetratricopeptide (TPR) repeat protein